MNNTKLKYYIWIIGCQMNKSDAERVVSVLNDLGFERTEDEKSADLIIALACSVRQTAIDRIYGKAKKWNEIKKNRKLITMLSGCVLDADKPKMGKIFDYLFNISDLSKLPLLLGESDSVRCQDYFKIKPIYESYFSAFIPIMTGCNNFCTYCAVPYTRGREKYRERQEIIKEILGLVKKGYKEITLLGQNVNSYGISKQLTVNTSTILSTGSKQGDQETNNKNNFAELLREVIKIPGNFWIRFLTSNPHDMSDEIIDAVAESKKICEYIHLPVQVGNNEVLKNMNRKYTREHYLELIEKIKTRIPGVAISTDTIVGFPGETKEQFKDTIDIYQKVGYTMAYIAQYSPRSGTVSAKMKDDVSREEKKRRDKELTSILEKTALKDNEKYINETIDVLVDLKKKDYLYGRTRTYKLVQFKGEEDLIGNFVKVKISSVTPWAMKGDIIE